MKVAQRGLIPPFLVMEALREAHLVEAEGKDVIHLSLGQPSARAPQAVFDTLSRLIKNNTLGYTDSRGLEKLRQRISLYYRERFDLEVPAGQIYITVGSSAAFYMSLLAAFDPQDRIAIGVPHYPAYPNIMRSLQLEPVLLQTDRSTNFQPTVAMLEALDELPEGLIIASPSNPSGTVIDPEVYASLVAFCDTHGIRILSDEIYHNVTYGDVETRSVLALSERMIAMGSFSKYFLLPGWRLGWAVVPPDLQRQFESLLQNFFISPPAISQYAALEVFDHLDALDAVVEGYQINRDLLLQALPRAGFDNLCPAQGAFYLYADVSKLSNDSREFCRQMLNEAHVSAIPGLDFDQQNGHHFVRFSYAGSYDDVKAGCERLIKWLG